MKLEMCTKYKTVFMRGGSSKGLFFSDADLPADPALRNDIFLQAMGSPDPYERQLNGMGGGLSSLSKVAVIAPSERPDADIDYTFGQVAVTKDVVDYGANCGNLSSAAGPFAVDEGLIRVADGEALVRIFNTNTLKIIRAYFPVRNGRFHSRGDFAIDGVAGTGSCIRLEFTDPAGSVTGKLLPTGRVVDSLFLAGGRSIEVSLIDASNPVVFVAAESLGLNGTEPPDQLELDHGLMAVLDEIRRIGGVMMGLAGRPEDVPLSNPKVALVASPEKFRKLDGTFMNATDFQISIRMLSMERVHRAVTSTGALCCAAAVNIPGTIPNYYATGIGKIAVGNPSGALPVGAKTETDGEAVVVESLQIFRTARRLMEGYVYMRDF